MVSILKSVSIALATLVGVIAAVAQIVDYLATDKINFLLIAVIIIFCAVPIVLMVIIWVRGNPGSTFSWNIFRGVAATSATVATFTLATTAVMAIVGATSPAPTPNGAPGPTISAPPSSPRTTQPGFNSFAVGQITSPVEGEQIPMIIDVTGSASDVSGSHQLWLFVEFISEGKFLPGAITRSGDQWIAEDLYVGGEGQAGQQFKLHLAELGPTALDELEVYFEDERTSSESSVGFPRRQLDELDLTFLDVVTVNRLP